jgi:RNA polymerase sigma factor (sigma-70 family)
MDEYRGEAEWAFLETIARTVAFNYIRASGTAKRSAQTVDIDHPDVANVAAPPIPDYAEVEEAALRRKRLYTAIANLPESQRLPLQLWLEGFKYDHIAAALQISLAAVKSRLHDAKKHLAEDLGLDEARAALAGREAVGS